MYLSTPLLIFMYLLASGGVLFCCGVFWSLCRAPPITPAIKSAVLVYADDMP